MNPGDPSNRRITLIVKYLEQNGSDGNTKNDVGNALPALGAQRNVAPETSAPAESPAKKK